MAVNGFTWRCRWRDAFCPAPSGLNLGKHNIRGGCGFGLPQEIWVVQLGNYDLMLLMDTKIQYAVY